MRRSKKKPDAPNGGQRRCPECGFPVSEPGWRACPRCHHELETCSGCYSCGRCER